MSCVLNLVDVVWRAYWTLDPNGRAQRGALPGRAGPVKDRARFQRSRRLANPNSFAISAPAAVATSATTATEDWAS